MHLFKITINKWYGGAYDEQVKLKYIFWST